MNESSAVQFIYFYYLINIIIFIYFNLIYWNINKTTTVVFFLGVSKTEPAGFFVRPGSVHGLLVVKPKTSIIAAPLSGRRWRRPPPHRRSCLVPVGGMTGGGTLLLCRLRRSCVTKNIKSVAAGFTFCVSNFCLPYTHLLEACSCLCCSVFRIVVVSLVF